MRTIVLSAVTAIIATACAALGGPTSVSDTTTVGQWGGVSVAFNVTPTGGTVQYDCAHGELSAPLVLDGAGRFDTPGTFVRDRPGPVRDGDVPDVRPARYAGRISGGEMFLTVTRTDSAVTVGRFTLQRDSQGRVVRCL